VDSTYLSLRKLGTYSSILLLILSDFTNREAAYELISRIRFMWKQNGPDFLVNYLKECHRLTCKAISGQPETFQGKTRIGTKRGLPLIIPSLLRSRIENLDVNSTRLVLTVLSTYRVIQCKPQLKVNTITDPFKGISPVLLEAEIMQALCQFDFKTVRLIANAKLLPTIKAGPNRSIACLGTTFDAYAFKYNYPHLLEHLKVVSDTTGKEL